MSSNISNAFEIDRNTLEGQIYKELKNRIVSVQILPGQMISENEMAAKFNVSRTPIRQAFFRLSVDGLLEIMPQRGALVSFISKRKVREAQRIREVLELEAFTEAANRWDGTSLESITLMEKVDIIITKQEDAIKIKDYYEFTKLDEKFHDYIIQFSGNLSLAFIVKEMRSHLNRLRYIELQEAHHEATAIMQHRELLMAIKNNEEDLVRRILIEHLKLVENFREFIFKRRAELFID
ncbi:GntR family transcriptional regulator [Acerihabitans sp.]|uniref:GntR family transcriptional regulator n=1 Tax=Acerihabitans sp. TaxID=2811394 RepID=UPI002ED94F4A